MSILSSEAIKALQADYMRSFPAKWILMTEAYKNGSWTILERELHKFSGSGATYKMPEISKLSKAIELYLEKNSPPNLELLWEALELFRQVLDGRQNDTPLDIYDHAILKKME
jgi:HPt (histidine-containing phosphotransfer) domain-containing protein